MVEALFEHEHITTTAKAVALDALGEHAMRGEKRRRARSVRTSTNEDVSSSLPSNKLRRLFKGASSHLEYQEIIKETVLPLPVLPLPLLMLPLPMLPMSLLALPLTLLLCHFR